VDAFSYLSVLLSIIIGLGLTQVLTASGRLIRHRERVRAYWPSLVWAAVLLLIFVQAWWAMFGMRRHTDWTFFTFLMVLLQTVTLYMMAAVVLPEEVDEAGVDLRAYYERQRGWLFGFLLATLVVSVVKDVALTGALPGPANLGFHAFLAGAAVSAIVVRRARYHEVLAVVGAVAMGAYIALLFARLQ
jgi:hypothetical protein